eukprot:2433553-Pyramimonas_sp.AAC.1
MAVFAHLEGGEREGAGCKRGAKGARPGSCVSCTVEVKDGVTDQQNESICVPTIIAHIMGGVRLGVMAMLLGVTDRWYLNTGTVLGTGASPAPLQGLARIIT